MFSVSVDADVAQPKYPVLTRLKNC